MTVKPGSVYRVCCAKYHTWHSTVAGVPPRRMVMGEHVLVVSRCTLNRVCTVMTNDNMLAHLLDGYFVDDVDGDTLLGLKLFKVT